MGRYSSGWGKMVQRGIKCLQYSLNLNITTCLLLFFLPLSFSVLKLNQSFAFFPSEISKAPAKLPEIFTLTLTSFCC